MCAAKLNMPYVGNDLSEAQIRSQQSKRGRGVRHKLPFFPQWTVGDSSQLEDVLSTNGISGDFDMILLPPYADLEVYSNDPRDISNMDYAQFIEAYKRIIKQSCSRLKNNRFAVFVVRDIRDKGILTL